MKIQKCSLYQCLNAKVNDTRIGCDKGHRLIPWENGTTDIKRLARGEPLELAPCQKCPDYDEMGEPVNKEDRGWTK